MGNLLSQRRVWLAAMVEPEDNWMINTDGVYFGRLAAAEHVGGVAEGLTRISALTTVLRRLAAELAIAPCGGCEVSE